MENVKRLSINDRKITFKRLLTLEIILLQTSTDSENSHDNERWAEERRVFHRFFVRVQNDQRRKLRSDHVNSRQFLERPDHRSPLGHEPPILPQFRLR